MIRVTNADYLARPLRLTPTEATAIIVALRALRGGADGETRDGGRPGAGQAEEAAAAGGHALVDPGEAAAVDPRRCAAAWRTPYAAGARCGSPTTCRPATRSPSASSTPTRSSSPPRRRLPRRLVPQRRGAAPVPARPDPRGARCSTARSSTEPGAAPRPLGRAVRQRRRGDAGDARAAARGPVDRGVLLHRGTSGPPRRRAPRSTSLVGRRALAAAAAAPPRPVRRVVSPRHYAGGTADAVRQALGLYADPAG